MDSSSEEKPHKFAYHSDGREIAALCVHLMRVGGALLVIFVIGIILAVSYG